MPSGRGRRVLFIQATEPAGYPPLIHASTLMAEAGWGVAFLSAPIAGCQFGLPLHERIAVHRIPPRPSHVMGKAFYALYAAAAARLAVRLSPDVVYASDPLGAGPGRLAARLAGARLVYHEHDSPEPGALHPWLARQRRAAARQACLVVFPNEGRARTARSELGLPESRLRIVWNTPRRSELPTLAPAAGDVLRLHYHGGITPERLPEPVVDGMRRFGGRVRLRLIGREAPGARGYVRHLLHSAGRSDGLELVEYAGELPRADVVTAAAGAQVGLALVPRQPTDINMRHMTGASNKAFDYMAAGLALLVSDLPDWRGMFVAPGYARACDPGDADSVAQALAWFLDHPEERRVMAARGRAKIETEWNYEMGFASALQVLDACLAGHDRGADV